MFYLSAYFLSGARRVGPTSRRTPITPTHRARVKRVGPTRFPIYLTFPGPKSLSYPVLERTMSRPFCDPRAHPLFPCLFIYLSWVVVRVSGFPNPTPSPPGTPDKGTFIV